MKQLKKFGVWALAITLGLSSCTQESTNELVADSQMQEEMVSAANGQVIPGSYIVVLNSGVINKSAIKGINDYHAQTDVLRKELAKTFSNKSFTVNNIKQVYRNTIDGFSVELDAKNIETLRADSRVSYIEPNRVVSLKKPTSNPHDGGTTTTGQEVPWGIARVNGGADGTGLTAWIIDSGIDSDHPDLNVDAARSADFTGSRKGWEDENGHGTHCSGTVGAIDNNIGVIGVAAGCNVVAVRVLDRRGSGAYDGVIAGVDYVAANGNPGDAANMSLGGPVSEALDQAVYAASQTGVKFALAAGNESDDALNHSPARVNGPNIYTISAGDINDEWAYFSNYGTAVDYNAPGYNIYSTAKGGGYETMSGTSMASPHACGVLLLGSPRNGGTINGDPDGNADVIIVH